MVVDQELGMPLELGRDDDGYWIGDLTRESFIDAELYCFS